MNITDSYPNPVPLEACIERQWRVVGKPPWWNFWLRALLYPLVLGSAQKLKEEIDESRAKDRATFAHWDALEHGLSR